MEERPTEAIDFARMFGPKAAQAKRIHELMVETMSKAKGATRRKQKRKFVEKYTMLATIYNSFEKALAQLSRRAHEPLDEDVKQDKQQILELPLEDVVKKQLDDICPSLDKQSLVITTKEKESLTMSLSQLEEKAKAVVAKLFTPAAETTTEASNADRHALWGAESEQAYVVAKHIQVEITEEKKKASDAILKTLSVSENTSEFSLAALHNILSPAMNVILESGHETPELSDYCLQMLCAGMQDSYYGCCKFDFSQYSPAFNQALLKYDSEKLALVNDFKHYFAAIHHIDEKRIKVMDCRAGSLEITFLIEGANPNEIVKLTENAESMAELKKKYGKRLLKVTALPVLSAININVNKLDLGINVDYAKWPPELSDVVFQRGGFDYYPPLGWQANGLKVTNRYGKGENAWLGDEDEPGAWAVAYHGLRTPTVANLIEQNSLLTTGSRQAYAGSIDTRTGHACGNGAYVSPHIETAKGYCCKTSLHSKNYLVAFQVRVNPKTIRIPTKKSDVHPDDPNWDNDYWIINSSADVRPYKILLKEEP